VRHLTVVSLLTPSAQQCCVLVDIGYGDLGCFGNPTSNTPAIDTMAAEGAKLVQYYSAASICSPSRGALMTGRTFGRIGIYPGVLSPLSKGGLPLNETTLAEHLETVGYTSGMCGKWHCKIFGRSIDGGSKLTDVEWAHTAVLQML
jgi:arylsulfatase A-like enzyme